MIYPDPNPSDYDDYEDDEAYEDFYEEAADYEDEAESGLSQYRSITSDPTFGYLIALALAVGLMALPSEQRDLRYTLLWLMPAAFGVLSWLLGNNDRIEQDTPDNLAWGVVFALIVATPLMAVGGSTLTTTVHLLFNPMSDGTVLAYLIFVMPLSETLFFRGLLQKTRPFWVVGLMSTLWSALMFMPHLDIGRYPAIGVLITLALLMLNIIYSYVRQRNGLAATWLCQITANLILIFFPYASI